MTADFRQAIIAGVERLTAWADILDRINVFPIADGDTGRNLVISLAPLRRPERDREVLVRDLLLSARGNSGNIASSFFQCFIQSDSLSHLPAAIQRGRDSAWRAVPDPQPGTMLSFFAALAELIPDADTLDADRAASVLARLEDVVRDTTDQQPKLRKAGVVDAGALGLFLYFEGFLHVLTGNRSGFRPLTETFRDRIQVAATYSEDLERGYCVDTVLQSDIEPAEAAGMVASLGESVVTMRTDGYLKVHFHTRDREAARRGLVPLGRVIGWAEDDLYDQTSAFGCASRESNLHIMTDAAGSLSRQDARDLGISLLDSYITVGDRCLPETYFDPEELYSAMRTGVRVTTAQASVFERHQIYAGSLNRHARILYLCVGSAFTGNYRTVMEWKREHDPGDRLMVMDTGAASGRLAVIVLAVAAHAGISGEDGAASAFVRHAINHCQEYLFLDRLEYLAAGGRLSKTGAFFGDMLRMKPIVSPMAEGARKVGVVHDREGQLRFAMDVLDHNLQQDEKALIMLEYSDNRPWVEEVGSKVATGYPEARIIVHPLSLTSGAHMGPETWGVAFLPDIGKA